MGDDHYAAKVGGQRHLEQRLPLRVPAVGRRRVPPKMAKQERLKETVMDKLIERELLAAWPRSSASSSPTRRSTTRSRDGKIVALGRRRGSVPTLQKDGQFNYESFKTFVRIQLQQTPNAFVEEQKKEMLASRVRNLVRSSVDRLAGRGEGGVHPQEPPGQPRVHPLHQPAARKPRSRRRDEEIAAYAAKNEAKLKEIYEQKKFLYEKAPAQRRVRQILVKLPARRRREGRQGGAREGGRAG